jgi:hypothetical protein
VGSWFNCASRSGADWYLWYETFSKTGQIGVDMPELRLRLGGVPLRPLVALICLLAVACGCGREPTKTAATASIPSTTTVNITTTLPATTTTVPPTTVPTTPVPTTPAPKTTAPTTTSCGAVRGYNWANARNMSCSQAAAVLWSNRQGSTTPGFQCQVKGIGPGGGFPAIATCTQGSKIASGSVFDGPA